MLEKSVVESIPEITISKRKVGRPKSLKAKPQKAAVQSKKAEAHAITVSHQHYCFITSVAELKNISRMDVLGGIIQRFVDNMDTGSAAK